MNLITTIKLFTLGLSIGMLSACSNVKAPEPVYPIPQEKQVAWHQLETYAFIHFGLNTFNDMEWGYGNTPASTFNPTKLDYEQWARTCKQAGMKGIILTAKHHDGFCLWPTQLTEYSIRNSPYKDGKGDVVRELAEACKKYGLKFAVYLSPWDRNHAEYGRPAYVEYFYQQLEELLTQYGEIFEIWFDGANGGNGWYGGADETRQIDSKTYYDYPRGHAMIAKYQPNAIIFSDGGPGCRWVGNEQGYAGETNWAMIKKGALYPGAEKTRERQSGIEDGDVWVPAECDVSIRPGWFYHESEDNKVKTPEYLVDLYYKSVGRNATFLLNFPVNKEGLIHPTDSAHAVKFQEIIQRDFQTNLMQQATITASDVRGKAFSPKLTTDGVYDTYWATADGVTQAELIATWKTEQRINRLMLQEYIPLGQRVQQFEVEYLLADGTWKKLNIAEETTTIGYKRLLRFDDVLTTALKVRILKAKAAITINEWGAYYAQPLAKKEEIAVKDTVFPLKKESKAIKEELFCIASSTGDYTKLVITETGQEIHLSLPEIEKVDQLFYEPYKEGKGGLIYTYELWAGKDEATLRKIAQGEFSNILNNPVEQVIHFSPIKAKLFVLKAIKVVGKDSGRLRVALLRIGLEPSNREGHELSRCG